MSFFEKKIRQPINQLIQNSFLKVELGKNSHYVNFLGKNIDFSWFY